MKVSELLTEYSPQIEQWKSNKRLQVLKAKLETGEPVNVVNAYYKHTPLISDMFTWGELQKLGFAKTDRKPVPGGYEERWVFTGPQGSSINVITQASKLAGGEVTHGEDQQVLHPGEGTNWVEVDYT